MRKFILSLLLFTSYFLLIGSNNLFGQEEQENIDNANTYLDHRVGALEKSLDKTGNLQQQLLKRLKRKEDKMLRKLAKQDSALYKQYLTGHTNYDSIAKLSNDTTKRLQLSSNNKTIDSLKGIKRFIENQSSKLGAAAGSLGSAGITIPGTENLNSLQQKLNVQTLTDQLIQQHTSDLKQLAGGANISGLQNIQKDVFYTKQKIKAYKDLADDPDAAEQKAFESLQGVEGFDKYLNQNGNAFGGLGNDASEASLQSMGYQTKSQVDGILQSALGNNMNNVQQQMSQQIIQYSDKLNGIKKQVDAAKNDISQAKQTFNDAKNEANSVKNNLKNVDKPDFKVNKEKGKPFWKRIETQYNFQTSRSSTDGTKPAMMNIGASAGYKQTEKLTFGLGLALNTGLGQNWQHLKLSYEGITIRANADWLWIYGFSFQAGYERSFIPSNRSYLTSNTDQVNNNNQTSQPTDNPLTTIFGGQQQTAYVGVMKRYKITTKWNGTFMVGYNFLWQTGGESRSPWMIRFGYSK